MVRRASFSWVIIIFLLTFLSCSQTADEEPVLVPLSLEEEWAITGTGDDSEILGMIAYPQADSDGNIYLIDPTVWHVRSWNGEGEYRWSVGSSGRGPGELGAIASMYVNRDSLRLFDVVNAAIHTFDSKGEQFPSVYLPEPAELFEAAPLDEQHAIIPNLMVDDSLSSVLHVMDIRNGDVVSHFADPAQIRDADGLEDMSIVFSGTKVTTIGKKVIMTPSVYNGTLSVFEEREGKWSKTGDWAGYTNIEPAYSLERLSADKEYDKPYHTGRVNDDFTQYLYITYHSYSMGLYPQKNGNLLHLSLAEAGEFMELVAEEFDGQSGRLLRYSKTSELNIPFNFSGAGINLFADFNKNMYLADNENLSLKKYKMNWEE